VIEQTGTNAVILQCPANVASLVLGGQSGEAQLDISNGSLTNAGTATILTNGTLIIGNGPAPAGDFQNGGTITVPPNFGSVQLTLVNTFESQGVLRVETGSELVLWSSTWDFATFEDGSVFDGDGVLRFSDIGVRCYGTMAVSNTIELDLQNNGFMSGPTIWTGSGTMRWLSGLLDHSTFNAGLNLEIVGTSDSKMLFGPCVNLATARWIGVSQIDSALWSGDEINNYGTIIIETNGGFTTTSHPTVNNYGLILVPADHGTVSFTAGFAFTNYGTVRVETNSVLEFSTQFAPFTLEDGSVFAGDGIFRFPNYLGGQVLYCRGTMVVNGTVELDLAGGICYGPSVWGGSGLLRWWSGIIQNVTFTPGFRTEVCSPAAKEIMGYCTNFSTMRCLGALPAYASSQGDHFDNFGAISVETNFSLGSLSSLSLAINNFGTITAPPDLGELTVTTRIPITNYGTVRAEANTELTFEQASGSAFSCRSGSIFDGNGLVRFRDHYEYPPASYWLQCLGNIIVNGAVEMENEENGPHGPSVWTGSGLLRWKSGFIEAATFGPGFNVVISNANYKPFYGYCTNQGTIHWLAEGPLQDAGSGSACVFNSGLFSIETNCTWDSSIAFNNLSGGTLRHVTPQSSIGDLTNNGTLQMSIGVLHVRNGVFGTGGTHQLTLRGSVSGTDFGQLAAQSLTVNGSLSITLTNSFVPTNGSSFLIATNISGTGQFAKTSLPQLPADRTWRIGYANNKIIAKVVSPTTVAGGTALPNGTFQFSLGGGAGGSYRIQASTNLTDWSTILSNGPFPGTLNFTDTNAPQYPRRFYRGQILD
jgi:hypothetical protein